MATPREQGGKQTAFEPGMVERVAASIRYAFTGEAPEWFGPAKPMAPVAPPEVKGRAFDIPVSSNLSIQPRREGSESGITFDTLRRAAEPSQGGLDLLRLAIETRKDQMEAQRWTIRGKDGKDVGDRAKDLQTVLRRPDLVHTYRQWQRMLMEDLLVIDAPTIYCRPLPGEGFSIPEVVDGATIKILSDPNGRRPLPPEPAYQQILKGVPAADYTLQELIYSPRNLRSNRYYGMSPVEQVVNIIILALNRQLHLTAYYTAGNIPEQFIGVPETWNPDQIAMAQNWLDSLMTGNLEARRKLLLVPGGMDPKPLKDPKLQDALDEWLARIICWCFSLPPSALVKEVNRATAETAKASGQQEGLEPLKEWWADIMNEVIIRCWGIDDLEFAWEDEEIGDPKVKMEFWTGFVKAKVVTPDEAREKALRMVPLTPEQKEELNPPPPPGLGGDETGEPGGGKAPAKPGGPQGADGRDSASGSLPPAKTPAEKLAKAGEKKKLLPIARERAAVKRARKKIQSAAKAYLVKVRKVVVAGILAEPEKVAKADFDAIIQILSTVPKSERDKLERKLVEELGAIAEDGAEAGFNQVTLVFPPGTDMDLEAMLSQANAKAVEWAEGRAAELVTAIDETTRDRLQDLTVRALEGGWSNDELAAQIEDGDLFSEYRAEMIARTETAFADVQGNMAGWRETGVVESVQWIMAQDEVCDDCQSLNGQVVPLDGGIFQAESGETIDGPPLHPNCRCDVLPVLATATDSEESP